MNNSYGYPEAVEVIIQRMDRLKSKDPSSVFVLVEGISDKLFYETIMPESSGIRFIFVGEILSEWMNLKKRNKEVPREPILNCEVIYRAVKAQSPSARPLFYGVVDRDYRDERFGDDVPGLIVTDACDLETTRIWSSPDSLFDFLHAVGVEKDVLSTGTDALTNSIQLFDVRTLIRRGEWSAWKGLMGVAFRIERCEPGENLRTHIERIRVALLSGETVFDAKSLIRLHREDVNDADDPDRELNEDYLDLQADIEERFYALRRPGNLLSEPKDGLNDESSEVRLPFWACCRGHDYFFFLRLLCPNLDSFLIQKTLISDSFMRRDITAEEEYFNRIEEVPAGLRVKIVNSFLCTEMGQKLKRVAPNPTAID